MVFSFFVVDNAFSLQNFKPRYLIVAGIAVLMFLNYRYINPNLMILKKYQTLQEALPKSRTEGYFYFLFIPAVAIFILFAIGIHFRVTH